MDDEEEREEEEEEDAGLPGVFVGDAVPDREVLEDVPRVTAALALAALAASAGTKGIVVTLKTSSKISRAIDAIAARTSSSCGGVSAANDWEKIPGQNACRVSEVSDQSSESIGPDDDVEEDDVAPVPLAESMGEYPPFPSG